MRRREEQPGWVQAGAATSMRLLQKAAERGKSAGGPSSHWGDSQGSHTVGSAGFEEAPWMGHGGVHRMDAGHLGGQQLMLTVYYQICTSLCL